MSTLHHVNEFGAPFHPKKTRKENITSWSAPTCALARSAKATSCANSPRVCCSTCCSRSALGNSGNSAKDSWQFADNQGKTCVKNLRIHPKPKMQRLRNLSNNESHQILDLKKRILELLSFSSVLFSLKRSKLLA